MNRRVFIQIALPGLIVGAILLGTCVVSAWYINRLQANLSQVLSREVMSLEAAQELEIAVRQLRYHCFLYLTDPRPQRLEKKEWLDKIDVDQQGFEKAMDMARSKAGPSEEKVIADIEVGYNRYRAELAQLQKEIDAGAPRMSINKLAERHPVRHVTDACQELLRINKASIEKTVQETEQFTAQARLAMFLLGTLGPLGGLAIGCVVARGISRSISQRQQQHERELLRAEQLAAVGRLAAGVAHEVRNPLAAIKMLVEAALRPANAMPLSPQDLKVIHNEIARLEKSVQEFLDFARLPTPRRAFCDLREVVCQAIDLVRARSRMQKVAVVLQAPEVPVPAFLDAEQMRTVFVNLLLNSLEAMPQGGRIDVEISMGEASSTRVAIADTGQGISPEIASRLFTPFASTKPTGTGLGLSLSRRIAEEHGGTLVGENGPEGGARFVLDLPGQEKPSVAGKGQPQYAASQFES
jgi:signal transduction histidine kinase